MNFKDLGFMPWDILLPQNVNMSKWACVACDQYTSEPKYWEDAKKFAEGEKSCLNLVFPEVYLGRDDENTIKNINANMKSYLEEGTFKTFENTFIYVERQIKDKVRRGIVGCVDLEKYDFSRDSKSLIRATEGTVIERIPPRVKIRENAPLELPHIMLLIDDEEKTLIESVDKAGLEKVYDFPLMMDSGNIEGYILKPEDELLNALNNLYEKSEGFLYAVGDGNHSLATAKTCWENIKKDLTEEETQNHIARYALVELVNIHDSSLEFEPIHRVMFNVNPIDVINSLKEYYNTNENGEGQKITYLFGDTQRELYIENPSHRLGVGSLQNFIDKYINENEGAEVDYIHGKCVVENLSKQDNALGFILEPMEKSELFKAVNQNGPLPRKTFSMGEAFEKRFYIEARKIK